MTSALPAMEIPTLPAVLDARQMMARLSSLFGETRGYGGVRQVKLRILQCHPGRRCTVEILMDTASGPKSLIGKVYASERPDVYESMRRIWHAGFDSRSEFSIPEPVAYLPELRLLLQERICAPRAQDVFLKGDSSDRQATAVRCGRWLARFQWVAPACGPVFDLDAYFVAMDRWWRRIARQGASFEDRAERLFRGLEAAAAGIPRGDLCAGHGSFSAGQIFLDNGRTMTFDWDSYGQADPARDVARFRIALRRLALGRKGSIRALDVEGEIFLEAYQGEGRRLAARNLTFFEAATCLQLAKYHLQHPVSRWQEKMEALLEEGLRILERGG